MSLRDLRSRLDQLAVRQSRREALFASVAEGAIPGLRIGLETTSNEAAAQGGNQRHLALGMSTVEAGGAACAHRRTIISTAHTRSGYSLGPRLDTVALIEPFAAVGLAPLAGRQSSSEIRRVAFLDCETSGIMGGAGTVAFLVGVGFWERQPEGWVFCLDQWMATDFDEEAAVIALVAEALGKFDAVCTYNGRSFDMPLLRARAVLHRQRPKVFGLPNLDLLPFSRRLWKKSLPNCSLKSVELEILRIDRGPDIDSARIPSLWFEAARTGVTAALQPILRHHGQDIVTLGSLLWLLSSIIESPLENGLVHRWSEWDGIARWLEKDRRFEDASRAMECAVDHSARIATGRFTADEATHHDLVARLATLKRRHRDWQSARRHWESLCGLRGTVGEKAIIEVAKLLERPLKRPEEALAWTQRWLQRLQLDRELCEYLGRGQAGGSLIADLTRREARLNRQLQRKTKGHD